MPLSFLRAARNLALAIAALAPGVAPGASPADGYAEQRRRMVEEIAATARDTARETGRAVLSERTLDVMGRVPRHRFIAAGDERTAYANRPLSIGSGQTISQPYIVALMTDLLELVATDRVLEIGTGSGYQAAVLAELAAEVYTVEIVETLAREAAHKLSALGYRNVQVRVGDGYEGWAEHAPYDAIMVTAAPDEIPAALVAQLKPGGRMAIPTGERDGIQVLHLVRKRNDGVVESTPVLKVRFVPFTGKGERRRR
jgi:protein-L-isoaspartate(D-aspartate) O-methyltransferase